MNLRGTATPGQYLTGNINKMTYQLITAYGIAVKNGFNGTEEEWLDSLEVNPDAVIAAVNAYMDEHPVSVDATLSISGMAADAKATGDGLARLDGHATDKSNPHETTAEQVGAAPADHEHSADDITSGALDIARGGTGSSDGTTGLKNLLAAGAMVLSPHQYGDELPEPGIPGRIFFKKVT